MDRPSSDGVIEIEIPQMMRMLEDELHLADQVRVAMSRNDLMSESERRHLLILRIVAAVFVVLGLAGVAMAFTVHWALALVALFFLPIVVYGLVVVVESIFLPS